eukprot:3932372-Pyramimonas_sp.AAC.1
MTTPSPSMATPTSPSPRTCALATRPRSGTCRCDCNTISLPLNLHVADGNTDLDAIRTAINNAKSVTDKPSFIKVSTLIGYGSPNKANSHAVHGAALGAAEVQATRDNLKWDHAPFEIPANVYKIMDRTEQGAKWEAEWNAVVDSYCSKYPEEGKAFKAQISGELPADWEKCLPVFTPEDK